MKFEFTIKDLEVETFSRVSLGFIKLQFAKYAGKRIGVYDYSIARSDDNVNEYTVVFRIIKPKYQIVYWDWENKKHFYVPIYNNLQDAEQGLEELKKTHSEDSSEAFSYFIKQISYLDKKI